MSEYLSFAEERELVIAAKSGDVDARNAVVMNIYHSVRSIVGKQFGPRSTDQEDAIQNVVGVLCEKFHKFDPSRNVRFSTYAIFWIRESINVFRRQRDLIRMPEYLHKRKAKALKEMGEERISTTDQFRVLSLDLKGAERDFGYVDDILSREPLPESALEQVESQTQLSKLLPELEPRELEVLKRRCCGDKLHEIGHDLRITKERVRQIECLAITKLRNWANVA